MPGVSVLFWGISGSAGEGRRSGEGVDGRRRQRMGEGGWVREKEWISGWIKRCDTIEVRKKGVQLTFKILHNIQEMIIHIRLIQELDLESVEVR